jgi:predicted murein hydrolase (TIGR00659 family)
VIAFLSIIFTVITYKIAQMWYHRYSTIIILPMLICPVILIVGLKLLHISYDSYNDGASLLSSMLQPATVALAVPMYKYRKILKSYLPEFSVGILCGAVFAIGSSLVISHWLNFSPQIMESLAPRSITTPIAIGVSEQLGGIPALTAFFVIATGIIGSVISPAVFKYMTHVSPITKGLMLGIAAHGTGTARAQEYGSLEAAIASLAMIFTGIITTLIAPEFVSAYFQIIGAAS